MESAERLRGVSGGLPSPQNVSGPAAVPSPRTGGGSMSSDDGRARFFARRDGGVSYDAEKLAPPPAKRGSLDARSGDPPRARAALPADMQYGRWTKEVRGG